MTLGARVTQGAQDVGGTSTTNALAMSIHGDRSNDWQFLQDGMSYNTSHLGGGTGYYYTLNTVGVQEITLQTGGFSAESPTAGLQNNAVPKEGSNHFSVYGAASYTDENFSGKNVTPELRSRNVTTQAGTRKVW